MAKTQFLTFEIHLTDPDRVSELQGHPPGETSLQGAQAAIIRAPETGAAVEFGNSDNGGVALPLVGPATAKPTGQYIFSEWFTSTNNFPRDVATFTRKSGGWFGIPLLFGTTTRFFWRGVFVYDPPLATGNPDGSPGLRQNIAPRNWIDSMMASMAPTPATPSEAVSYDLTRDAGRYPDAFGYGMRGQANQRIHTVTENTGGGVSAQRMTWERLYIRLRRIGAGELFWRCKCTAAPLAGLALQISATGQIAVYNVSNVGTLTLIGTTAALVIDQQYKLDIIFKFSDGASTGNVYLYLNNVLALSASSAVGIGIGTAGFHSQSEIGTPNTGYTMELDISFWMGATAPNAAGVPIVTGIDFCNGSRAVLVKPNGFAAGNGTFTGDWRTLASHPCRVNLGDKLTSVVALDELRVTMETAATLDAIPGSLGMVAFTVNHHGHRGTLNGQMGYKVGAAARVVANFTDGASDAARAWAWQLYNPVAAQFPIVPCPALELHRIKGNDAVVCGTDHLTIVAEIIGTFTTEDYPSTTPADLRDPLPYRGCHNAPYPRTPWARTVQPPISPVVIHAGTYVGNGVGQELQFRAPVNWLWIRHTTGTQLQVRWWSSMLGASIGGSISPQPWTVPDQLIDPTFVPVAAGGAPTGVGALPNRAADVATYVNRADNLVLLDGNEEHKRDLLYGIVRELNSLFAGDGNNWGVLTKTDRSPAFIPADIIMWKPTGEHLDVLTDTGPAWINDGVAPVAWTWTSVTQEGSQEQRTLIRVAGADQEINQLGETYQYVAVSDPGQRFMLNGAVALNDVNANIARNLIDSRFLALFAFLQEMRPGTDTNIDLGVKGPGHTAGQVNFLNAGGTSRATAWDMALGTITPRDAYNFGTDCHYGYSLWRSDDGSADAGIPKVVKIGTYVGNGAGARVIPLGGVASGVRPLWALVSGPGVAAYMRDSSHAGANATSTTGANSVLAITAGGVDSITVNSALNANLQVYNFFVLMGSATGTADGWSINGEYVPVEPTSPTGSQWGADAEPPEDLSDDSGVGADTPGVPGGGSDGIDTDLETACLPFTHKICNIALSRVGISQPILALGTENTEAAQLCRLHYADALEQTLRDFPWPFATRYANLILISGSTAAPVNRDWTYAYEQPSDCVFERRIVVVRDGAVDPTPPPFQLSFDNTLGLNRILTNQASARLEYTARPECSAGRGDPLFRDAVAWKLAGMIAGPLSRVENVMKLCSDQYDAQIAKAREVLRPGNPGPKTTLDPDALDPDPDALEANISVVNMALLRIGARTIANLDQDQSREAAAARVIFEEELRQTLRAFPWAFATAYEDAPTLFDGSATAPANNDWTYAYVHPTDALFIRRIVDPDGETEHRSRAERIPEMFRVGNDNTTGKLIFTNLEDPVFEYTARILNCVLRADPLFREAFAWKLAASLAPSLGQVDPDGTEQLGRGPQDRPRERKPTEAQLRDRMAQRAMQMFAYTIQLAQNTDANEQQIDPQDGEADWIIGRL